MARTAMGFASAQPILPAERTRGRSRSGPVIAGNDRTGAVAAAAVGAQLLPALELDVHELAAARAVLQAIEADFDFVAGPHTVLPTELHELRDRAALERPCRDVALVAGDVDMQPAMRVDELELLHRARQVDELRLIEHGEGVMREGGAGPRQQRRGKTGKAESFGHGPLLYVGKANHTTNAGAQKSWSPPG